MRLCLTILLLCISQLACSQYDSSLFHSSFESEAFNHQQPLMLLVGSDQTTDFSKYTGYQEEIEAAIEKLASKREKLSETQLLEKVFYYTHRKFLKKYTGYVSFAEVFEDGSYDCLTGTALYAVLLEGLGIPYVIYEFDFHLFLLAYTNEDSVLMEATDPMYGLVTQPEEIARRVALYTLGEEAVDGSSVNSQPSGKIPPSDITNRITLRELTGLQYFNLAVEAFNAGTYDRAQPLIQKANLLYPSRRIQQISKVFDQQYQLASRH